MNNKTDNQEHKHNNTDAAKIAEKEQKLAESKKKIEQEAIEQAKNEYIRVGDKYYKKVEIPDKRGNFRKDIIEKARITITDDLGRKAFKFIPKYEDFAMVPTHVNYQRNVGGFYNKYHELSHVIKPGTCDTIINSLKHIFREKIEFILDYLTILYLNPSQRLPIILLESKEKNTGKSTYGTLISLIFEANAIKIGNQDFESNFNGIWINKLVVIVDETRFEEKLIMDMIKRLSTETGQVISNEKNKAQSKIDFIGKFVFISNEEGCALPIENGDTRFAVFKVNTFASEGLTEIPNIEDRMTSEIPAFLHYLTVERKMAYPRPSHRMYFHPEEYKTDQLLTYFRGSLSHTAKGIKSYVSDALGAFPDESVLRFSANDLLNQLLAGKYTPRIDRMQLKNALHNELRMTQHDKGRFLFYNYIAYEASTSDSLELSYREPRNTAYYEFNREVFLELD